MKKYLAILLTLFTIVIAYAATTKVFKVDTIKPNTGTGVTVDGELSVTGDIDGAGFSPYKKGIQHGCNVSKTDANTLSISPCRLGINGEYVNTTVATSLTWGCSGCTSDVGDTKNYIYAKTTSTGTTLNLLINQTAPNADGFDGSGNKVLASVYNDTNAAFQKQSISHWTGAAFDQGSPIWESFTPVTTFVGSFTPVGRFRRVGGMVEIEIKISFSGATNATAAGFVIIDVPSGFTVSDDGGVFTGGHYGYLRWDQTGGVIRPGEAIYFDSDSVMFVFYTKGSGNPTEGENVTTGFTTSHKIHARIFVPVVDFE